MRIIIVVLVLLFGHSAWAQSIFNGEDGYRLWLKYDLIKNETVLKQYKHQIQAFRVGGKSETSNIIRQELDYALTGLLGDLPNAKKFKKVNRLIIGTPKNSSAIKKLKLKKALSQVGDEGYVITHRKIKGQDLTIVAANTDIGTLYGTYALLRMLQTNEDISHVHIVSAPKIQVRTLNHWDNPNRHVERGYAGSSIWDWHKLPDYKYQRYYDYARANASIGINGTVLNNVNANSIMLTPHYLEKVEALADIFRPYGIKVYLSVKFSSPELLGGLKTSDPLDPGVQQWWKDKATEIYKRIPDFGGFLVKANSEGQPGPGDFNRTHAEGANMLADALQPYGGIVMWRAFVYANEKNEERSKQAYSEFKPLDGKFRKNILIQVKNGPIDFQPREPFSPLFGGTPETPMMMEFQITMEYLGFSTHFVYLGTMYEESLSTDTFAKGAGSTIGKVIDGSLFNNSISGIAGVSNIGADRNWTGHIMLQANWFVFGRMAWNNTLSAKAVADEWIKMTLSNDPEVVHLVSEMMMDSRENTVNYMTPLGLHHIMGVGHHYGPGPWVKDLGRDDWTSVYYHQADKDGVGFDRSPTGVNSVEQYHPQVRDLYASAETIPEEYLLWFHHLPWDYKVNSGKTLWDEIVHRYYEGADAVIQMAKDWDALEGKIDPNQFRQVQMAMDLHVKEAIIWRNSCVLYFQSFSKLPIPKGLKKPAGTLADYEAMKFPFAPGRGGG